MQTYYLVHKLELMREFNDAVKIAEPVIASRYGVSLADSIVAQMRQEFESLLFHIPYVGGKENPLTESLVQSAWYVALYRVLKSYGKSVMETGELLYNIVEATLNSHPHLLTRLSGKMVFARFAMARLKQHAEQSQQRVFEGNWVYSVVEGDGATFNFGVDYTQCAICEFYKAQNADELLKYVCLLDFPISKAQGTGLVRTMSIGEGHAICDFRFKDGRDIPSAWPPHFKQ